MGFLDYIQNTANNVVTTGSNVIQSGYNQLTTAAQPVVTTLSGGAAGVVNATQTTIQNASSQVSNVGQSAFTAASNAQDYVSQKYIKPYAPSYQEAGYMLNRGLDSTPVYSNWVKDRTGLSPSENFLAATSDKGLTVTQQNQLGQTVKTTYGYNDNKAASLPMSVVKGFAEGGWNEPIKQPFVFAASLATAGVAGKVSTASKATIAGAKAYEGAGVGAKIIQTFGTAASSPTASKASTLGQIGMLGTYITDTGARITGYGNPNADTSAYGVAKRAGGILTTEVVPGSASTAITKQNVFKGLDWLEEGVSRTGFKGLPGTTTQNVGKGNVLLNPTTGIIVNADGSTRISSSAELSGINIIAKSKTREAYVTLPADPSATQIMGVNVGEVNHVLPPNYSTLAKKGPLVTGYHNHLPGAESDISVDDFGGIIAYNLKDGGVVNLNEPTSPGYVVLTYVEPVKSSQQSVLDAMGTRTRSDYTQLNIKNTLQTIRKMPESYATTYPDGTPVTITPQQILAGTIGNKINANVYRVLLNQETGIGTSIKLNDVPGTLPASNFMENNVFYGTSGQPTMPKSAPTMSLRLNSATSTLEYVRPEWMTTLLKNDGIIKRKQPVNKSQKKYVVKKPKQTALTAIPATKPSKFKRDQLVNKTDPLKDRYEKPIQYGEPGSRHHYSDESDAYNNKGGWKLHLTTEKENYPAVDKYLHQNHRGQYKILKGGEPGEKDVTVYVGAKDDAHDLAVRLENDLGSKLSPSNAGGDDTLLTPKVAGRFDIQTTDFGRKTNIQYYGKGGLPYDDHAKNSESILNLSNKRRAGLTEKDSIQAKNELNEHHKRIHTTLTNKYGTYYTGTNKHKPFEPTPYKRKQKTNNITIKKSKPQTIKPISMGNIRGFGVQKPIKRVSPKKILKPIKQTKQKSKGMLKYFY
jgi:hypothetical protein